MYDEYHHKLNTKWNVCNGTVTYQNQMPAFRAACPYVLAYVELEEGPRVMTHIVECEPEDVHVGQSVRADFSPCENGLAVLRFRPQ